MKKTERLKLIPSLAARLAERDWPDITLVLREFDVEANSYGPSTDAYEYCLHHLPDLRDDELLELDDYLGGRTEEALHGSAGPWTEGFVRLFLSHMSAEKAFVGEVKDALAEYGIDGFVAHSDIEPTAEWVRVIELALGTCDALAAFLHPDFVGSRWCDQEVGYVFGRRRLLVPLMFGVAPHGFLGQWQGAQCQNRTPAQVASTLFDILLADSELRPKVEDALIAALHQARQYAEANARAQLVKRHVSDWTPERVQALEDATANGEVTGAWTSGPIVKRLLQQHGHLLPATVPPSHDDVPF